MSKETPMAPKQIVSEDLDEGTAAAESLHPQTHTENDPKTKVETLKAMVGAANCLTNTELTKWYTSMIDLFPAVGEKPVGGTADSNRKTNNMKSGGKNPLAPMPMVKIKEDMDALFEGDTTLTEETKDKITTLFEAAVGVRAAIVEAELEEAYAVALEEEVDEFISETEENISAFLDYAIDKWMTENEVAIVDSLRLENAEEFMDRVKTALVESFIDVPEERLDVVHEMSEHVDEVEGRLSDVLAENLKLKALIADAEREAVLADMSEGLTLVDAEKLATLVESIEYTDVSEYGKKVFVIKEKYFAQPAKTKNEGVETLNEENLGAEERVVYSDPLVEAAVAAMNRNLR